MDSHAAMIWQRGSARQIMREARKRFEVASQDDLPSAYVALASTHYSLVKRYRGSWPGLVVAAWHVWRAVWNVNCACAVMNGSVSHFSADQVDVITTIWVKTPRWMGGDPVAVISLLNTVLYLNPPPMKPHTRALMLIRLAELETHDDLGDPRNRIEEAEMLIPSIKKEDSEDREQQLVRILFKIGVFYLERHSGIASFTRATDYLDEALSLADRVSKDQAAKIRAYKYVR